MLCKKTLCLNFYSGPGAGKSTIAADVFAQLKKSHVNCELITEYAKKVVWEGNTECLNNQLFITANQQYQMWSVAKHVDLIITDSPLLLGCIYSENDQLLHQLIFREYSKFDNIDVFLERQTGVKYQSNGRLQTLDEAIQKDNQIKALLSWVNREHFSLTVSKNATTKIVSIVKQKLA